MSLNHWPATNRETPYTAAGIKRRPCARCGKPASTQWQVCADGSVYRPLCTACDVALNALVLKWAGDPLVDVKVAHYALEHGLALCQVEGYSHEYQREQVVVRYQRLEDPTPSQAGDWRTCCRHCGQSPA